MPNPFVHAELATTDLAAAQTFYGQLFDWKLDDTDVNGDAYTLIDVGENEYGVGGGMLKAPMAGAPSAWLTYVSVDDLDAATKKAQSLGGRVIKDVTAIPGMGSFSIIADPTGAMLGLWKADRKGA